MGTRDAQPSPSAHFLQQVMAESQTDWEVCGERRRRARRVAEVLAAKEEEYRGALHHRRCRLRALLEGEAARLHDELKKKFSNLQEQQLADRVEAAAVAQEKLEEERLRRVHQADDQRRRQQCHQYREAYSREMQRYLNESRPHEITLKNHMRRLYGVDVSRPKKP
ncbi:uncharacterized protein LOC121880029 [Homarus americanus]|uniref:Uncharacterized protein n=1 Tax=Homarus americanus TaxID=6706 RepID=A0A8J5NAQ0_HOMAM|nr:uncharacterized protein LOC121880029 [Homarus americanus]KAG7175969.1 hypothetical protein Hamer_G016914 [Homarus americanus]